MLNEKRMIENFLDMIKIPSPSLNERKIADYLKKILLDMGLEVEEDNAGKDHNGNTGNIIAVLKSPGKKKFLFSSHMDTVTPCEKILPIIENGIIKTDGTSVLGGDDKAGIAAIIEMIRMIQESEIEYPEIIAVFSIAEEIGLLGAQSFDLDKYKPDLAFVIDSGGVPGTVVVETPYVAKGKMEIIGKGAHAGVSPELGINALTVAAHAITKIRMGRIDEKTTSNIGIINGGSAVNIVMPNLSMSYEARSFSGETLDELLAETFLIFEETTNKFGAEFKHNIKKSYNGYKLEENSKILKSFEKACKNVGIKCRKISSGGGCDANIYSEQSIISVNIGIGMSKVHTTEEFIKIDDIVNCTKLIYEIVKGI
ncbi:MAG: M20/M25/M40 family metallo-hydrolase [Fusobacteriaceae bacterium]